MKRQTMTIFAVGLALFLGVLLVTPQAEAVTKKKAATLSSSPSQNYTFVTGEDSRIWYTLSSSIGSTRAVTGNANHPIDAASVNFTTSGFLAKDTTVCSSGGVATGDSTTPCVGIWFATPGSGTFQESPSVSNYGPISASSIANVSPVGYTNVFGRGYPLPATEGHVFNIVVPGQDNNLWYTIFDALGIMGGRNTFVGGATASLAVASTEPFAAAGEDNDTGFVRQTGTRSLSTSCASAVPVRTCVGIWVPMP